MNRVQITSDIVDHARQGLPAANVTHYGVMDIEVLSADGQPAMIEFERILIHSENNESEWRWEATTCWLTEATGN